MPYIGTSPSNGVRRKHTYTATASQTSFSGAGAEGATLSYNDSNFVDVYQNGVKLSEADYTSTTGTTVVLATGATVSDMIEIVVYDVFSVSDTVSKSDGGTFDGNVTMAGTLDVTGASTLTGALSAKGGAVFNEDSADADFRVESNANINMLLVDSGGEVVTIGGLASTAGNEDAGYFPLQVGNTGSSATIMQMLTSASGTGTIHFGDAVSGAGRYAGYMFYNHSNNSLGLGTSGATQVTIDSTGAMTKPNQPAFLARPASDQDGIAINADIVVAFGTEIFDQNADFSSNTFTAPVDGRYHLDTSLYCEYIDTGTNLLYVTIVTSNRTYYNVIDPNFSADANYWTFLMSVLADMDANDTAQVKFTQIAGTAQANVNTGSHFSGYLVC